MSIKTSRKSSSSSVSTHSKKARILALAIASGSLLTGLSATSTVQAAELGDLFGNSESSSKSKFLPVDQAFQVSTNSTPVQSGTRLAINFDITPEHYVYKKQIKLTLPAGVTAAPFTFSQTPYSIDDPTFGQVLVFDQANMVATT
ncbi:MAG: protein-disulfide reductase DsbD N-terminal domain-containing protein, partial [Psychrobacter sp.]